MRVQANRILIELAMLGGVLGFAGLANGFCQVRGFVSGAGVSSADTRTNSQSAPAPVLLELFTSEGCSSCPPADALLKELDGRKTAAGQMLIGLSEHVTYWNNLGWTDPFSSDLYTQRQSAYGERFHLDSVYTPQLVINGTEQVVGSDRRGLAHALDQERQSGRSAQVALQIQSVRRVPDGLAVKYTLSSPAQAARAELFAAVADDMDRSSVLRGENEGRTLSHVAVVRSLVRVGAAREAAGDQEVVVHLPTSTKSGGPQQHLVLFAQEANFGPVLGVAEQPLTHP